MMKAISLFLSVFLVVTNALAEFKNPSAEEIRQRVIELKNVPWNGEAFESEVSIQGNCIFSKITIPVLHPYTKTSRYYHIKFARPRVAYKVPFVIILPTLDGETILEPHLTNNFCSMGIASMIADVNGSHEPEQLPGWDIHDRTFRWAMHTLGTIVDWSQKSPYINGEKLGVIGSSMGGVTASMFTAIDHRIKASIIIGAGTYFPGLLTYSKQKRIRQLTDLRMKHLGIRDRAKMEQLAREHIRYDNFYFKGLYNRDNILQVVIHSDKTVISQYQETLWDIMGRPTRWVFSVGHVASILSFHYLYSGEISDFFQQKLMR